MFDDCAVVGPSPKRDYTQHMALHTLTYTVIYLPTCSHIIITHSYIILHMCATMAKYISPFKLAPSQSHSPPKISVDLENISISF